MVELIVVVTDAVPPDPVPGFPEELIWNVLAAVFTLETVKFPL